MGCLFAGFLAAAGEEVVILDKRADRAQRIRESGIKIEGVSGDHAVKVNVVLRAQEISGCDLVIIAVKSYDTESAVQSAKSLAKGATSFLTLQNGIGNVEIISKIVGEKRAIGGVTSQGAPLLDDGHIRHAGVGDTVIGRADGKVTEELRKITETFTKAGLSAKTSDNIEGLLWSKLIINVGINGLTAVAKLNNGRLVEFEGTHNLLKKLVAEALAVAQRKQIKLIYDDLLKKVEDVCRATAGNVSSMLQDVLKRRKTEIDYINGAIVREAEALDVPTPINSALTEIVHTIEQSYDIAVS